VRAGEVVVAEKALRAESPWERARGLLGGAPRVLWLEPCASIHTFGMRFAIDVVFLGKEGQVLRRLSSLPPGRIAGRLGARACVEFPCGWLLALPEGAWAAPWRFEDA